LRTDVTSLHRDSAQTPIIGLFVKHYEDLVDHVRRRFGDKVFAYEVVQDVCLQLLQRPPTENIQTPLAFLRHLSINRAVDRWRGEQTQSAHVTLTGQAAPDLQAGGMDGEQLLTYKQTVHELQRKIEGLPPRCREVFILHKLHELSQEEVAERLHISRNMVAKHISRAMTELNQILKNTL
jgi:RNA polymerase sigma factor (sigma-70 family)